MPSAKDKYLARFCLPVMVSDLGNIIYLFFKILILGIPREGVYIHLPENFAAWYTGIWESGSHCRKPEAREWDAGVCLSSPFKLRGDTGAKGVQLGVFAQSSLFE